MPELRSGAGTSPDSATVDNPTRCPSIAELMPILDRPSAAEPAGEGKEWVIACVKFIAPEFWKTDGRECTWCWWLRYRALSNATSAAMRERAKVIVWAQYAPPLGHQESCDLCHAPNGGPRFVIPDLAQREATEELWIL
jgi:hypothetical protein